MHRRDLWESGDCFPLATVERITALVIDGRTIIRAVVQGQPCRRRQLSRLLGREPYGLARAYEADQPRHHVHLDMTVEGEVSFEVIGLGPTRPVLRVLSLLYCVGQQQDLGRSRLDNERLGRTDASDINRLACEVPPLGMWVKVVPHHAKVEVEDVPEDFLAWVGNDCRSVADERAAVEAVADHAAPVLGDGMSVVGGLCPMDLAAGPYGHVRWVEDLPRLNGHVGVGGRAHHHSDLAL